MPVFKAPVAPAVVAPWTGFFVGGHIGYGNGTKTFINDFPVPDGIIDANPAVSGWLGGFQVGYNYQINWLVLGVEGDFTWAGVNSRFSCFTFEVCSAAPEWFSTTTGRVGAALGPALFYVTGGLAWVHDSYTNIAAGDLFVASETRPGWTVGLGAEYLFMPNWSLKVEYDHMNFGSRSIIFDDGEGNFFTERIKQNVNLVKAGVNYKFGGTTSSPALAAPASRRGHMAGNDEDEPSSTVAAFTGIDVGKWSFHGWAGGLIAPWKDLDTSGLRVYIYGESGIYKYLDEGTQFRGTYSSGDILAGYGFEGDNYSVNLLLGLNASNHMVSPFDPENSVQGTAGGVKVHADAHANPTPQTMTYGEAEYSTAFRTYYTAGKVGFDVTSGKEIFVGPEVGAFGDAHSNQWRVGGHVSNLKFGKVQVDVSAGYANDSVVGTGAYGHIELNWNF